eukprot:9362080-Pyramimonas_sp.AAC.1
MSVRFWARTGGCRRHWTRRLQQATGYAGCGDSIPLPFSPPSVALARKLQQAQTSSPMGTSRNSGDVATNDVYRSRLRDPQT